MDAPPKKPWRVDLRDEPLKDRLIALLCGLGIVTPIAKSCMSDRTPPWEWPGDRITVIILFILIGVLAIFQPED